MSLLKMEPKCHFISEEDKSHMSSWEDLPVLRGLELGVVCLEPRWKRKSVESEAVESSMLGLNGTLSNFLPQKSSASPTSAYSCASYPPIRPIHVLRALLDHKLTLQNRVLESLKAGKRLSETPFSNLKVAPKGQKSVYALFQKTNSTGSIADSGSEA